MEETYRTKAIILNRQPFQEDGARVVVYTRDRGKLELVARGTRKIKSKLAGHTEPVSLSDIMVVRGKQYDYIGAAVSKSCFSGIKSDLTKLISVGQAINIFNKLVKENQRDEEVFTVFKDFLETINSRQVTETKGSLLSAFFIFKLLSLLGYKPELYNCLACKSKIIQQGNSFDFKKGGLICAKCSRQEKIHNKIENNQLLPISNECVKVLRLVSNSKFDVLQKLTVKRKLREEIEKIVSCFHEYIE